MRNVFTAAAVAVVFVSTSLHASAADVLDRVTSAKLGAILTASGGKNVAVTKPEAGVEVVSMGDDKGTDDFVLSDCTADGCSVMQMTMFFNKNERFNLAVVNGFNGKYLNAQASLTPDGRVYLVRLFVTTGGVTEANVKANIDVFTKAPGLFVQHVLSQATASAKEADGSTKQVAAENKPGVEVGIGTQSARLRELKLIELLNSMPNRHGRDLP